LPAAVEFAKQGIGPGAIARNLASFGDAVAFDAAVPEWLQRIMADAQTSGGLLAAVAPESVHEVLALFHAQGFAAASVVGMLQAGAPRIGVVA
jgi:selenide,water dikinase